MSPAALIETSLLMGLFVLAGGAYGGLYCLGRVRARAGLVRAAAACCVVAFALALAIVVLTPLDPGWKALIVASALAYAAIPPITLRHLQRLHADPQAGP